MPFNRQNRSGSKSKGDADNSNKKSQMRRNSMTNSSDNSNKKSQMRRFSMTNSSDESDGHSQDHNILMLGLRNSKTPTKGRGQDTDGEEDNLFMALFKNSKGEPKGSAKRRSSLDESLLNSRQSKSARSGRRAITVQEESDDYCTEIVEQLRHNNNLLIDELKESRKEHKQLNEENNKRVVDAIKEMQSDLKNTLLEVLSKLVNK